MENLKTLGINGMIIHYQIFININGYAETKFYIGTTTRTYKKYGFFGEVMIEIKPKYVFSIFKNIEYNGYTKNQVRSWIEHELTLLKRAEEIKNGELI
jgi:hypothetical protein